MAEEQDGGGAKVKKGKGKGENGGNGESTREFREGELLVGMPSFEEVENGRLRCVETGHEVSSRDMIESYGRSKGCRVALIDAALKNQKPPLNMFEQDPKFKSKLICKLTGDTVNKSEEHIWKHVSGKKFQKKLDQKEKDLTSHGGTKTNSKKEKIKREKVSTNGDVKFVAMRVENQQSDVTYMTTSSPNADKTEDPGSEEPDFWVPPVGSRWDFDNGKDRWEIAASETGQSARLLLTAPRVFKQGKRRRAGRTDCWMHLSVFLI
ncbi:surfeit locus protein 2 (SURF2) isoform X2 [Wolffia australiana]